MLTWPTPTNSLSGTGTTDRRPSSGTNSGITAQQFECTSQLIQLYISSGLSLAAVEDARELARTEPESRIMLQHESFTCALPDTLAPVFAAHLSMMTNQPGGPAAGLSVYAKYISPGKSAVHRGRLSCGPEGGATVTSRHRVSSPRYQASP